MFDFAIAGFPKCGTSSLWAAYKQAGFPMYPGEPDLREIDGLARQFGGDGRPAGFKSAVLVYQPETLSRLYAANPRFRVLVGLRDPVEWAWSWFWFQRKNVEDACASGQPQTRRGKRLRSGGLLRRWRLSKISALDFVRRDVRYPDLTRGHGMFHVFLNAIYARLPAENILLFDISELGENWKRVATRCLGFVGKNCRVPRGIRGNVNQRKPAAGIEQQFWIAGYDYYRETYVWTARVLSGAWIR